MAFHQNKPITIGMVGGGPDSGIGETHRIAMRIDNKCELIAGAFSRSREKSLAVAQELRIADDRIYNDYRSMAAAESKREDKIDAVCVVTPTDHHFEVAKTFLEAGIHVICDKPLCVSLSEAKELLSLADKSGLIVCLTHNYTGYAMVRQAAKMVKNGELGEIKAVHVEHASGWASKLQEDEKKNEPSWRMNPTRLGDASLLLDLGTHAHHLARFVTGLDERSKGQSFAYSWEDRSASVEDRFYSNPAIRRKTAIDRDNHSRDEAGRIAGQPDGRSDQIVWQSEPAHRSVVDNSLPTVGKRLVSINQQRPVLIPEKKAGGNGIYS